MLSLIAAKFRADGGLSERADKLLSIHAAVLAIQLSSERALLPKFWLVAHAQTIRSMKSPDGSKSVRLPFARRLILSKRWRRDVLFRQQSRDQARSPPRSNGVTAPPRRASAGRVPTQRGRCDLDARVGQARGSRHRHRGCSDQS